MFGTGPTSDKGKTKRRQRSLAQPPPPRERAGPSHARTAPSRREGAQRQGCT